VVFKTGKDATEKKKAKITFRRSENFSKEKY
jgi:hypothetical protein